MNIKQYVYIKNTDLKETNKYVYVNPRMKDLRGCILQLDEITFIYNHIRVIDYMYYNKTWVYARKDVIVIKKITSKYQKIMNEQKIELRKNKKRNIILISLDNKQTLPKDIDDIINSNFGCQENQVRILIKRIVRYIDEKSKNKKDIELAINAISDAYIANVQYLVDKILKYVDNK